MTLRDGVRRMGSEFTAVAAVAPAAAGVDSSRIGGEADHIVDLVVLHQVLVAMEQNGRVRTVMNVIMGYCMANTF